MVRIESFPSVSGLIQISSFCNLNDLMVGIFYIMTFTPISMGDVLMD